MSLHDASMWAMDRAIRACEEKRLDPPAELPTVECVLCRSLGYFKAPHCDGERCEKRRYCPCTCFSCKYVGCDLCDESGETIQEI